MDKKKLIFIGISVLVCFLVYLPTPKQIDPQEYNPAPPVNLDQLEIAKDKLDRAVLINTPFTGAEDIEFDHDGNIYSGLHDGTIIQVDKDTLEVKTIGKSQGAIFGIDINSKGDKLALADQVAGIKILDLKTGVMEYVVSQYEGSKFASPNAVVFGQNDQVLYFTVSSSTIPMSEFHQMLLYSQGSGRIFSYDLNTKNIQLLADKLFFANGLEYSAKENCLYYVETGRSRLSRLQLKPQKLGNKTVITDNILGYPDNVKQTQTGDLWIAVPALRDSFSNIIDHNSIIRRMLINLRVPLSMFLALANMKYAGGIKVNPQTGQVVDYFFGNGDRINCISGINQNGGRLYLSSLGQSRIAVVSLTNDSLAISQPVKKQQIIVPAQQVQQQSKQQPVKQVVNEVPVETSKTETAQEQKPQPVAEIQQQQQKQRKQQVKQQIKEQIIKQPAQQQTKHAQQPKTAQLASEPVKQNEEVSVQQKKQVKQQQRKQEVKVIQIQTNKEVPAAKVEDNNSKTQKDEQSKQQPKVKKQEVKPTPENKKNTATTTTSTENNSKAQPKGKPTSQKPETTTTKTSTNQQKPQTQTKSGQQPKGQKNQQPNTAQAKKNTPQGGSHNNHNHKNGNSAGGKPTTKGQNSGYSRV